MGHLTRICTLAFLLTIGIRAESADEDRIDALIRDLGNKDPEIREKAFESLLASGAEARDKVAAATQSPKIAISSAATDLLMKLPWTTPDDSPVIRDTLKNYGTLSEIERSETLLELAQKSAIDELISIVRILRADPSSAVQWEVALQAQPGENWSKAVSKIDLDAATAPFLMLAARHKLFTNDIDSAKKLLERSLAKQDDVLNKISVDALLRLYDTTARLEMHSEAAKFLSRAFDTPDRAGFVLMQGDQSAEWPDINVQAKITWHRLKDAQQRKDHDAAITHLNALVAGQSDDAIIYLDVLPDLEKTLKPEEIEKYFTRVYEHEKAMVAEKPQEAVYHNSLAWTLARSRKKLDEAAEHAETAVKLKPEEAAFLDTLAEVRFLQGKYDQAIELETKASQLLPDDKFIKEQLEKFKKARGQSSREQP